MNLPRIVLICLTLTLSATAALAMPAKQPADAFRDGKMAESAEVQRGFLTLNKGDLAGAEAIFRQELKRYPQRMAAMFGLADVALRRGNRSEAESWVDKALAIDRSDARTLAAAARFFLRTDRLDRAEALYTQALKLSPRSVVINRDLGDLYLRGRKDVKQGLLFYRQAVDLDKNDPASHFSLGMALATAGDEAAALASLQTSAELAPKNPIPLHTAGRIHAHAKRYAEAIAAFSAALKREPRFLPALLDRADIQVESKRDAAAIADYLALLKLRPKDGNVLTKLGMSYQRSGKLADARNAYLKAIEYLPNMAPAYNNLAMLELGSNGDLVKASQWAAKAVSLAPQVPQFFDTQGQIAERQGAQDQALAAYEQAARLPPPQADVLFRLAQAYQRAGRRGEALKAYQDLLKLEPGHPRAVEAKASIAKLQQP